MFKSRMQGTFFEMIKKVAWIRSHHLDLQWIFKLLSGKFTRGNEAKHCWVMSTNFWKKKFVDNAQQCFAFYLKQTFLSTIWIFTKGKGEIESRLPLKIFSTLLMIIPIFCIACLISPLVPRPKPTLHAPKENKRLYNVLRMV